ncbi:CDCA2 protein, partial [Paradoxornis webbianus]|nr:CDCA2 protein [Sinosuthora webbiana]
CDRGDAVSHLSPRKAEPVEDSGILDGKQTPGTPVGPGNNIPSCELSQSSSLLRSILKKTPGLEPGDSPKVGSLRRSLKKYPNTDRGGGGESAAVSSCVKTFETLQTDTREEQSSKTPRKKKVTFGQVLSPEIFDQNLPANTPLRRGASPGCPQSHSPRARPGLPEEPLPLLDFGWDEEGVEPLPELLEDPVAAAAPVEEAEVAESDKPAMMTPSSTKRKQGRAQAEGSDQSSGDTENNQDTKNPRRSKIQRQRNPNKAGPK